MICRGSSPDEVWRVCWLWNRGKWNNNSLTRVTFRLWTTKTTTATTLPATHTNLWIATIHSNEPALSVGATPAATADLSYVCMIWYHTICVYDMISYDMYVWYIIRYVCMIWYHTICVYDMISYDMCIWYDIIRYMYMIWYHTICVYDMISYVCNEHTKYLVPGICWYMYIWWKYMIFYQVQTTVRFIMLPGTNAPVPQQNRRSTWCYIASLFSEII